MNRDEEAIGVLERLFEEVHPDRMSKLDYKVVLEELQTEIEMLLECVTQELESEETDEG